MRTAPPFNPDYVSWVLTPTDLKAFAAALQEAPVGVCDLETTGLRPYAEGASVVLASFTLPEPDPDAMPTTWLLPLDHPDSPWLGKWRRVLGAVAREMRRVPLVNHNVKFDAAWIHAMTGIDLSGQVIWDTQVSSHLLDETASTKLKERVPATFAGVERWDDFDLNAPGAARRVPLIDLGLYAARDTYWTWQLYLAHLRTMFLPLPGLGRDRPVEEPVGSEEVDDARLGQLARRVAMPMIRSLGRIEQSGINLDLPWVTDHLAEEQATVTALSAELADRYERPAGTVLAGPPSFAATSKWFMAWAEAAVAVDDLRVIATTGTGRPQWSKAVLIRLARNGFEVAEKLRTLRQAAKRAEYLGSWLQALGADGRIHANYHAGRVITGRLSSCVTADTLIDMPRDMVKYPHGVPITEVKPGDWVYSFDYRRELTLRQVEWVGKTGVKPTVVVTMHNSHGHETVVRCTPDHLIRLRSGDYRHAERLQPGNVVMPMVRRGYDHGKHGGYLTFFPHSINRGTGQRGGGKTKEHRWVAERVYGKRLSTKLDVHHVNGTMLDNSPGNLQPLTMAGHRALGHSHPRRGEERERPATYLGPNDYRVVSVEHGPVEPVWDMTVPEDHCFVANGIVVHNSDPNMQQVTSALKPAFVPTSPSGVLIDLDFSQIELRVAAFISRCEPMLAAFRKGDDLHRLLAARITGKDPADVLPSERQAGKSANFGLLYGMGVDGFREYAETVYGVILDDSQAAVVHHAFFDMWPGLAQWHARTVETAHRVAQVTSPIGRIRRLPDIHDGAPWLVSHAERNAVNSPVQGFASDLMQTAAASIAGVLPGIEPVHGAELRATVHDSILVEAPADDWQRVALECRDRMRTVGDYMRTLDCTLDVPLEVSVTVGTRWGLDDVSDGSDLPH